MTHRTDAELIAEFLAQKGATKIEEGKRAYDPRDIRKMQRDTRAEQMAEDAMDAQYHGHRVIGWDSNGNIETE